MKKKHTLRDYLHALNVLDEDVDMRVDGTDCRIAVEGGEIRMTPYALKYFKDALDLPCDDYVIVSDNHDDYERVEEHEDGPLALAVELLKGLAGYCPCQCYEEWFEGENAELI